MTSIPKSHMAAVDRDYWDLDERAQGVHNILWNAVLQDRAENPKDSPSDWDILCWAVAYLRQQSVVLGYDALIEHVRGVNNILWSIHYSSPADLYGLPDKREFRQRAEAASRISKVQLPGVPFPRSAGAKDSDDPALGVREGRRHTSESDSNASTPIPETGHDHPNDVPQEGQQEVPGGNPGGDNPDGPDAHS